MNSLSLNNNKVYALPIVGLHALQNSTELIFTHIMYMKIP